MKIGIDGTVFSVSSHLNRGIGRYTKSLLTSLLQIDLENRYEMIMPPGQASEHFSDLNVAVRARKFPGVLQNRQFLNLQLSALPGMGRSKWRSFDVIFFPTHLHALILPPAKSVVTILDLIPDIFPTQYRLGRKEKLYSLARMWAARGSKIIISISESSKRDIVERYGVKEERVRVIHLAPDETFNRLDKREVLEKLQCKFGIQDKFVLYVGGFDYRKNLLVLVAAFSHIKRKFKLDHKLIMAGAISPYDQFVLIFKKIVSLDLSKEVLFTDFISDEDLALLYNGADLFVFPSLYEGFGLPPLEAMACGTPVVTSSRSSIPEMVGDAALIVDPDDVEALADAMHKVLSNEALRADLVRRGLQRAKAFSWEKAARETLNVFHEAVQS